MLVKVQQQTLRRLLVFHDAVKTVTDAWWSLLFTLAALKKVRGSLRQYRRTASRQQSNRPSNMVVVPFPSICLASWSRGRDYGQEGARDTGPEKFVTGTTTMVWTVLFNETSDDIVHLAWNKSLLFVLEGIHVSPWGWENGGLCGSTKQQTERQTWTA
jgi:hypothetical protein